MPLFSKTGLQTLADTQESPCVSIYIPTHQLGAETQQDPIRLKNQLSKAEKMLAETGVDANDATTLLQPAADLVNNQDFWQHQNTGLALFLSPGKFHQYTVPVSFEELVIVSDQFHIKPLLPLLANDGQFYILAASQNKVGLYQATHNSVQAVDLGSTPLDLATALRYDDPEESIQGHSASRSSGKGGDGQMVFNGQGSGKDSENTDILRFFQAVADGVQNALAGQQAPLVFMGVDFLFPMYKQANNYPHLMEEAVAYQPDQLSPEEIRDRAFKLVEPKFQTDRKAVSEQYGSLQNNNQATADLSMILDAAHNGQIDTLLLASNTHKWGSFDVKARQADFHAERTASSRDLLDLAASKAMATDAKVYIVDRDEVPEKADAAATLRYPVTASQAERV
ncbi:MAG: hypothetical protein WA947_19345 [Phormidesmis sp.]